MYFKRLEINGFKSFADPIVIDFHQGITCIVGPNGSGKSNISDAIRWVLGEQSPKALRGGKMEEVIFAGTSNRKPKGMAEVTLVIDNEKHILDIDYHEVAITRRMYRSGESEYLINGNHCRLKDIRQLIMDTGIGVDGYSIIGQGKIAEIVSSKPEGKREIFEEAAGIVMYKNKKAEAQRKLESTQVNLDRIEDIVSELDGRVEPLRKDSEKAKLYLELKERYKSLEINIILKNLETMERSLQTYKSDLSTLENQLKQAETQLYAKNKPQEALAAKRDALDKSIDEKRELLITVSDEISELVTKEKVAKERNLALQKEKSSIEESLVRIKERKAQDEESIRTWERKLQDYQKEIEDGDEALRQLQSKVSSLQAEFQQLSQDMDADNQRLFDAHNMLTSSNTQSKSYESIKETLINRKVQLQNSSKAVVQNLGIFEQEADKHRRMLANVKDEIHRHKQELQAMESDISKDEIQLKDEKNRLYKQREELGRVLSRKRTLEELEQNYEGYNSGVKALMKEELNGIIGVVADLMDVPKGYETAIETALGPAMQNIVCVSDKDAKEAVNFLKRSKGGRLTFLPVSSVKGQAFSNVDKLKEHTGFLGLGSDLVKYSNEHSGIFKYLLGKVAIVSDMDSAIALSKAGHPIRLVTLEGEVVNWSGAITGGAYKHKGPNLLGRKSEIQQLEQKVLELERTISIEQNKIQLFEKKLEESQIVAKQKDQQIWENEKQALDIGSKLQSMEDKIIIERDKSHTLGNELSQLELQLQKADESIASLRLDGKEANALILKINEASRDKNEKLESVKSALNSVSRELDETRLTQNSFSHQKEHAQHMMMQLESSIAGFDEELGHKNNQLKLVECELEDIGNANSFDVKLISQKKEEREALEKDIEEKQRMKEVCAQQLKHNDDKYKRAAIEQNTLAQQKTALEIKVAKGETQMENQKDRLWEDFETSYIAAMEMKEANFSLGPAQKESKQLKGQIKDLGDVNIGAIEEYQQVSKRLAFLVEQRDDVLKAKEQLEDIIKEMDSTIKVRFKENFDKVVVNFAEIFKEMFGGGFAELRMEDERNPLESGIEIIAQPPGKKLQNINLMSGGEKTMTAIALMFAVLKAKPTPFCILDEVEAALDDANVQRFAKYLRNFNNIQFALVTHQKATMEYADVLYGITMAEQGISQVLSLKLEEKE